MLESDGGAGTSSVGEGAEPAAGAEPIAEPPCEETDTCPRLVFVSSERRSGDQLRIHMADALCTTLARTAGLSTRPFVAWVSTTDNPAIVRFEPHGGPYVRPDGVRVAANLDALMSGALENPIEIDERKVRQSGVVWTGTRSNGAPVFMNCEDWTEGESMGAVGRITASRDRWSYDDTMECWTPARIYCFEQ